MRSYLHTNGTMAIRDAPLEALEALECVELSSPPFLALLVLSSRLYSPLKKREWILETVGESRSLSIYLSPSFSFRMLFRVCTSELTQKADTTPEEARRYLRLILRRLFASVS